MAYALPRDAQSLDEEISRLRTHLVLQLDSSGLPKTYKHREVADPVFDTSKHTNHADDAISFQRGPYRSPINAQPQCRFFALPFEIRSLIYAQYFCGPIIKFCPLKGYVKGARGASADPILPLLVSCRRMYLEVTPILYNGNTWWLLNHTVSHLPSYLSPPNLHSIRHIKMHYHTEMQSIVSNPAVRLNWLATCRTLSQLRGLQTLDLTLYTPDNETRNLYPYNEPDFLAPLALITRPRNFILRLRWAECTLWTKGDAAATATEEDAQYLERWKDSWPWGTPWDSETVEQLLPENCELVREFEANKQAEIYRTRMERVVTEFPQRYCLVGWEEDCKREPESINECYPIPCLEGQRKGFLRTYRSMKRG